jgi:hypothetical protein
MTKPHSSIHSHRQFTGDEKAHMKQLMVDVTLAAAAADPRTADDWRGVNPQPGDLQQFAVTDRGAKYRIEGLDDTWVAIERESDTTYQANVIFTDDETDYLLI